MLRFLTTLLICGGWAPTAAAGPSVALLAERAWSPSVWITSARHRSRVGARLGFEIGDMVDLELSGSWQPTRVYGPAWLTANGMASWESRDPNFGQPMRHNQILGGVDFRYTPLRGVISLADEAVLPVQISAVFGLRAARQRQSAVVGGRVETGVFSRQMDAVLVSADLRVGPNVGAAVSLDLNSRLTLRADLQATVFLVPRPTYELDAAPDTPVASVWPSTAVGVVYRL